MQNIHSFENIHTHKEVAEMFDIGIATLRRWLKLWKDKGNLEPKKPSVTRPRKISYEKIKEYIDCNPDKTLKEIGIIFDVKNVFYIVHKLK